MTKKEKEMSYIVSLGKITATLSPESLNSCYMEEEQIAKTAAISYNFQII